MRGSSETGTGMMVVLVRGRVAWMSLAKVVMEDLREPQVDSSTKMAATEMTSEDWFSAPIWF